MHKFFVRWVVMAVCLSMLCVGVAGAEAQPRDVYVRSDAAGTGSETSPVGSLADAFDALGGAGGRIVLLDAVSVNGDTTLPEQSGDVTITAAAGGGLVLASDLYFAKNTNDNLITIDCPITVSGSSAAIVGGFNSITITKNTTVSGTLDFYGGADAAANGTLGLGDTAVNAANNRKIITELPYAITVNGGTYRHFAGGSRRPGRTTIIGSVAGDLTVTINGGTFGEGVTFTADSPVKMEQAFSLSGMSILAANATLTVNGGTFNVPVYAQGHMGEMCTNASAGSQITKSDRKYYAIDGDITMNINGGTFNGCEISAFQNSSVYSQIVRGNFTLQIGENAVLADGMTLDATQVKAYDGKTAVATLTYPTALNVNVKRFDVVNGEVKAYDEPLRIACIGDSITQGSGTTKTQETESYPAQLLVYLNGDGASRIDNRDVILSNFGCSGTRVMQYSGQGYTDMLAYTLSTEEADPDWVIIGLGTNDAGYLSIGKGQLEHFRGMYTDLLTAYGSIPGVQQVYCTTATYRANPVANGGQVGVRSYGAVVARSLQRAVVEELSKESDKFTCIDLYSLSLTEALNGTLLSGDNLHPATSGYAIYMRKVADAIIDGKCTVENFEMTDLYVSANGTNNAECTEANPTNNLSIAFAKAAPNATVHIVDSYTCTLPGAQYCIILPAIESLKIVGEDDGATFTTNCKYLMAQSDLILDNLTLTTTAGGAFMLQMGYHDATLTETFSIPKKHAPMFAAGYVSFNGTEKDVYYNTPESISTDRDCEINVLGGTYYYFIGGNYCYLDGAPFGTYSGNMTLNIGEKVVLPYGKYSTITNGVSGMNYLTGSVTANVASWADAAIPMHASRGAAHAKDFAAYKNTGSVTINLAEGMTNEILVSGDFNGDKQVTIADALYMLKAYVNNNFDKGANYFDKDSVTLRDVVSALADLTK